MFNSYSINTLIYDEEKCTNCGMCTEVCPHQVFVTGIKNVILVNPENCMECGACQLNCPSAAVTVDSGVGCASAMIWAALRGKKEVECGPSCSTVETG
ncbi:MAG: mercury methylation ferredoxin HgcB [Candidatus Bathyarchaeota archaeon]|nr:mercury methylation ferredoxin HgcB [Candidatus Bathyarchaeota archaeon]